MDYSKKQEELDLIKWVDSEIKNYDTCGEYDYCSNCNKNEAYPCAYAYEKYFNTYNASKTLTKNKATTSKTIKTTTKKSTCKTTTTKTSAKKPASKKTTTTKKTTKVTA